MSTKEIKFNITPFSPLSVIIGLMIQTFYYGWDVLKTTPTAYDIVMVAIHVFVFPFCLFGIIALAIAAFGLILAGIALVLAVICRY